MRQMNAHHKRIHAVLRETDPLLIEGGELILAAAYPWHHGKVNEDGVRRLIEGVIEEQTGLHLRLRCVLADEAEPYRARAAGLAVEPEGAASLDEPAPRPAPTAPPANEARPAPADDPAGAPRPDPAQDELRVRAAANIFNARPV
jgi:hypothetical protein